MGGGGVCSLPAVAQFPDGQYFIVPQPVLDFTHTVAPYIHCKNLFYDVRRFRVGYQMIAVIRVDKVAVRSFAVDALAFLRLCLFDSPDFL